ncbi:MAG: hypothetical protein WBD01_10590 [Salaquimonas sp.]
MTRNSNTKTTTLLNVQRQKSVIWFASVGFILIITILMIGPTKANAGDLFPSDFPLCDARKVEKRILKDFNWAENKTWQRGFELTGLSKMHEHRTANYKGSEVTRRYCMARAHFSNGKHRSIFYMINDKGGFAGQWWRVTHCVSGLDPWRNHDGNCRAIR